MSRTGFVVGLVLLGACSAGLTFYATREGVGLSPDADTYIAIANRLAAGEGLHPTTQSTTSASATNAPATHYPPLYSLTLAGMSKLGVEMMVGARILNMLSFAAVVVLAGMILRGGLALDRGVALLGAAMVAVARHLLYINTMVLSDGVFLVLLLAAWAMLGAFLDTRRTWTLVGAGVLMGLAMMTRYAAVGLAAAGGLAVVFWGRESTRRRVVDAGVLGVVSGLPIAVWIARNVRHSGSAVDRTFAVHLPGPPQWERAAETIAQWLWPTPAQWLTVAGVITVVLLAIVAALSHRNARREGRPPLGGVARVMLLFVPCYGAVVLTTVTFADANMWMDFRILAPLQLAVTMLVFAELARSRIRSFKAWPAGMLAVAVLFIGGQTARAVGFAHKAPELYVGYSMVKWRDSQTLRYIEQLPQDTLIYTNATALLRLRTGRRVKQVPPLFDTSSLKPLPGLEQRLRVMERDLRSRGGYVIYFDEVRRPALVSLEQVRAELKLRTVLDTRDGEVLQLRPRQRD